MAGNEGASAVGVETRILLPVPDPFDLHATCMSHGWIVLPPNSWNHSIEAFQRVEELSNGQIVRLYVQQPDSKNVVVTVWSSDPLSEIERSEVVHRVTTMLRLNEDLSEFERLCDLNPRWRARVPRGGGRLLRSPTVFEDVVKTICTTNTTWAQTRAMVTRLVKTLGKPHPLQPEDKAFPTPQRIAAFGAERLRSEIRLGYRADYIAKLAHQVATGELDLEALRSPDLSAEEVRRRLRQLPGIGPYGAATVSMLLGHYDELAIDSEMRAFVSRHYYQGRPVTDAEIRSVYAEWGRWKYLAYWFDPSSSSETSSPNGPEPDQDHA